MEIKERLEKFKAEFEKSAPRMPMISVAPYRGETTVFSSKFGGVPYFPKGAEYPTVREGELAGRPLRLLAQINFAEVPHIENFPEKGILQFFAGCDGDNVYGMNFKDGTVQDGFRVIYHENITENPDELISETPAFEDDDYPFKGEFALKFGVAEQKYISCSDYKFDEFAVFVYNKVFGKNVKGVFNPEPSIYNDDKEFCDGMFSILEDTSVGSKIGGYPYFTQEDPRGIDDYGGVDTLLLQIDSGGSGDDEIMWGDCGVANFFISSEALKRRDFSCVLYNWDCC